MHRILSFLLAWCCLWGVASGVPQASADAPAPCGPTPSENQVRWQQMEYYAFVHLSLNTYTDQSWGYGDEPVRLFNPKDLDCRQWARICKEAGMKGIILTAKHHCGFCLWPSKYTEYSVKNSPWRDGKGDLVREMSEACREYGLKFGVYLSPWDRNHPDYGKPAYIEYFRNQLTELLTNYGPVFEVWFDGANGGTGYYGGANENRTIDRTTYYDWKKTYALVRSLQPDIVIWNDGGDRADLRWVGTEEGYVGETNWSLLNGSGEVEWDMLHHGVENGNAWVPAEVNTSIRPEWFYHPDEDAKVKSLPSLMDTYYNSIGRNATLLLNFPIMPNGRIHAKDEAAVLEMGATIRESFANNLAAQARMEASNVRGASAQFGAANTTDADPNTYWATDDNVRAASLTLDFGKPTRINRFLAQEYIQLGQRVESFRLEGFVDGKWRELASGTTIGYKRILRFPSVETTGLRFTITGAKACPAISNIGAFNAPVLLNPPVIRRDQGGRVSLSTVDVGPVFYYTVDGSEPTPRSTRFTAPFPTEGKVMVRAICQDPATGKTSQVAQERFDVCRKDWRVLGVEDHKSLAVLDGNPSTAWHQGDSQSLPVDLVVDMGSETTLSGFRYLPDQARWSSGLITRYEFSVSVDKVAWITTSEGEFSNIKNNPVWQVRPFAPTQARYFRLRALGTTDGHSRTGYAEVDVLTN